MFILRIQQCIFLAAIIHAFYFGIAFGQNRLSTNIGPLVKEIFRECGQLNQGTARSAQAHQLCIQATAAFRQFGSEIPATPKEIETVCGKGPGQFYTVCVQNFAIPEASVAHSTVTATSPVVADGASTSTVTVTLLDARRNALGASGGTVVVSVTGSAQASRVTDNRDGTYSATLTVVRRDLWHIGAGTSARIYRDYAGLCGMKRDGRREDGFPDLAGLIRIYPDQVWFERGLTAAAFGRFRP